MKELKELTIILPTYEEKENLPLIVWLINKYLDGKVDYEIIVVDDGSKDGTYEIARTLGQIYNTFLNTKIRPFDRKKKLGLGTAYKFGLERAFGEYIILMDADLSHHPKYISKFMEEAIARNSDIVTGTRYRGDGGVSGWDIKRKLISSGANTLTQMVLGSSVSDLTGSFRLYKKPVLKHLIDMVESKGYAFQMEIIILAEYIGYRISEVPISFVDRIHGNSKMGFDEIWKFVEGLVYLAINY